MNEANCFTEKYGKIIQKKGLAFQADKESQHTVVFEPYHCRKKRGASGLLEGGQKLADVFHWLSEREAFI